MGNNKYPKGERKIEKSFWVSFESRIVRESNGEKYFTLERTLSSFGGVFNFVLEIDKLKLY